MSAITGDSAFNAFNNAIAPVEEPANAFGDLSSEEFVNIMLEELSNQDPLEPNDSQALLEQISTIRSIESDLNITQQFEDLVEQNEFASAANLLGTTVVGRDTLNGFAIGTVESISQTRDGVILNLSTRQRVPVDRVTEILAGNDEASEPDSSPPPSSNPDPSPTPPADPVNDTPAPTPTGLAGGGGRGDLQPSSPFVSDGRDDGRPAASGGEQ
ncbi:MAG: flagellar hook capping FlgD N-terminal domain-containing protein [Planctomycetota bacterium]